MKRALVFFSLILFLGSCGTLNNGKLRFVKARNNSVVIVDEPKTQNSAESEAQLVNETANTIESKEIQNTAFEDELSTPTNTIEQQEVIEQVTIDDSLETRDDEITNRALQTQKMAVQSTALLAGGIIGFSIPFLGLVLFIWGASKYINARKERYNTMKGERYLTASTILLIINSILVALVIFVIVSLLIAFVF